ncbi:hypothetical protein [Arcanobacterium haemolyticum]|uniref:hypothetical protein n=1 Tax=Arcanobacterium haemolyticum TaxID=28264 RepID=UPI0002D8ED16
MRLIGVEPAGEGLDSGKHGAPLERGKVGILHGSKSYVLLGEAGDVEESYSISAGLDYPGVGLCAQDRGVCQGRDVAGRAV